MGICLFLHFLAQFWSGRSTQNGQLRIWRKCCSGASHAAPRARESVSRCRTVLSAAKYDEVGSLAPPRAEKSMILGQFWCPYFKDIDIHLVLQRDIRNDIHQKVFKSWCQWCKTRIEQFGAILMHSEGALGALFRNQKTRKFPQKRENPCSTKSQAQGSHIIKWFPLF